MFSGADQPSETLTDRLVLSRPELDEVEEVFTIASDPRVWGHFPSGRHSDPRQSAQLVNRWVENWHSDGLGPWIARRRGHSSVIGYGGCNLLAGSVWNLSYRFAPDAQGHGYATELAREALNAALQSRPDAPVVAYLLEHNHASARVAQKMDMALVYRGPDTGNPDAKAVRLIYATRPLSNQELNVLGH